jgi:hypothetical protein
MLIDVLQLRSIIKATRSSPQQGQAWFRELRVALEVENNPSTQRARVATEREKCLILDVPTRWSSTYLMLGEYFLLLLCTI